MMRSFPRMGTGLIALAACLVAVPALADVKAGVDAWAQGDYRKAVEEWRPAAIAGDATHNRGVVAELKVEAGLATQFLPAYAASVQADLVLVGARG